MKNLKNKLASFNLPIITFLTYIFLYVPIAILVIFSFNSAQFPAPWHSFTLKWYKELFSSEHIWTALINSLIVAFAAVVLTLMICLGLILYLSAGAKRNFKRTIIFFYGNLIVPEVVLSVGLLSVFSFFTVPLGLTTLIIGHTVLGLGYAIPIIYARFEEINYSLIEASLDLGATKIQTFFKVILPLLFPSLIAASLLVFIISFDDFILSFFCSGSSAQTLSLYIFAMIRTGISPIVNALSAFLLVMSSFLVLIFCSLQVRSRIF
ncbi:ABC transporter permease [Candidatus Dependentiae bacterium]|nr:ABC transporter permease [Candidatus Dependentiae bacterium]